MGIWKPTEGLPVTGKIGVKWEIETTTIGIDPYFYYDWCEMIPSVQIHCMYLEMHIEMKFLHSALKRTEINSIQKKNRIIRF